MPNSNLTPGYVSSSDYALCNPWGEWEQFLLSYGLKPYNIENVKDRKRILEPFREQRRYEWELKQKSRK
jgi:hypothetical protein